MKGNKSFKTLAMRALQDLLYVFTIEAKKTYRDLGVMIFFVVVPLLYPLLYGYIYSREVVREVPTVVVDASASALSRDYVRRVDATPEVKILAHCADMLEAQEYLKQGRAYGVIYVPADFSEQLAQGHSTTVSLYCDMSGLLYYKGIVLANTAVSLEMNSEIKIARSANTTVRQDELTAYPIAYQDVALFNPAAGFASFLLPAVLILIIQQTMLLGVGLSAGTTRERSPHGDLVPHDPHYTGTLRVVLGKALSYFLVYALVSVYVLEVVPWIFDLIRLGHSGQIMLFILPYLLACIFFAMTASAVVRHRETGMLLFVFTSVPLLFLSGISWPGAAIAPFWRYVSYLFPSTMGINGFVKLNSMGASLAEVAFEFKMLWAQAGLYFLSTCWIYYRQIVRVHSCLAEE